MYSFKSLTNQIKNGEGKIWDCVCFLYYGAGNLFLIKGNLEKYYFIDILKKL